MFDLARRKFVVGSSAALPIVGAAAAFRSAGAQAATGPFVVEVAINAKTFVFTDNGNGPTHGAPFVVKGPILEAGSFKASGDIYGIDADGNPIEGDKVIGAFYCRGWLVNEGLAAKTGPNVATTQIFDLSTDNPGQDTLVTDGFELAEFGVPCSRAIVGGTGKFAGAKGEMIQTNIAGNPTGAPSVRFEVKLDLS